ncbi:MAG: hypothetical protein KJO98_10000 [Rhodothermia bacterium]|nr:hypothetical protein [Rhodothermia bacterium]
MKDDSESKDGSFSAWFIGPKAENSAIFNATIRRITEDHEYWRRNYFPEDGVVITSDLRRTHSRWNDRFEDRLQELLAALKADFPFQSPRYAAHMLAEQTIPAVTGYYAGMLYNPNNVSKEASPVTLRLEREAGAMIAEMLGYDPAESWSHLTSGGTIANLEGLWVARTTRYLPFVLRDIATQMDLDTELAGATDEQLMRTAPSRALWQMLEVFDLVADRRESGVMDFIRAYRSSDYNIARVGMAALLSRIKSQPLILAPETHHYCLSKILDLLGLGRDSLRIIPVDSRFRMREEALQDALHEADKNGSHVLAVVTVAGSTEEGAVDPIHRLVDLRARREEEGKSSFWLHADAAYGGYLRTTMVPERVGLGEPTEDVMLNGKRHRLELLLPDADTCDALDKLGECDSIAVDPHKLGYVPYPAGAVCFKSNLVRPIMRQHAPYVEDAPEGPREEATSEAIGVYILEGSKPGAAAASVWLAHKTIPLETGGHGKLVRETIRNAAQLYALVTKWPELTGSKPVHAVPLCPPESNIVCFAFRPSFDDPALTDLNRLNRSLYEQFSIPEKRRVHVYEQRFFLSRTVLYSGQYSAASVEDFLTRLGVSADDYDREGVFLLRSTLMNPWYTLSKKQGKDLLVDLVSELYDRAEVTWSEMSDSLLS